MKVGTRSVLFGAYCFILHPFFVFAAWRKLYGFPYDPRLWIAFFVHDIGYLGKPNMDGKEGELHPYLGAKIMRLFGQKWHDFTLYHSRFLAKKNNAAISKLCIADKLSICLTPSWIYVPMVIFTGEYREYMKFVDKKQDEITRDDIYEWYRSVQVYLRTYVEEHKDGKLDTWTPEKRISINKHGLWK